MKRNQRAAKPGFTLIELLTVIAIIAILASILFPVFGRVREATRQATTMEQMHSVYVALKQYHEDNGKYPPVLYSYVEVDASRGTSPAGLPAGTPYSGDNGTPIAMEQAIFRPLIGQQHYLRDKNQFLSADHVQNDPKIITTSVVYPKHTPLEGTPVFYTQAMYRNSGLEDQYANLYNSIPYTPLGRAVLFYAYDSYDSGPALSVDANGNVVRPSVNAPAELHYSLDWTGYINTTSAINDRYKGHIARNQLKYNNAAPEDSTVITWSTDHATVGGSDHIPVLFLNGRVRAVNVKEFYDKGPLGFYSPTLQ